MDLLDGLLPVQRGDQSHQLLHHLVLPGGDHGLTDLIGQLLAVLVLVGDALHQVDGGEDQLIHRGRHGHHVVVPVVDVAPAGGYDKVQLLLLGGGLLILLLVDDGDIPQLPAQGNEHQHAAHHH